MLSVVCSASFMLSDANKPNKLHVIVLSVFMLNVFMLNVIMLNVIMLSVVKLSVVKLSVAMLSVAAPYTVTPITLNVNQAVKELTNLMEEHFWCHDIRSTVSQANA